MSETTTQPRIDKAALRQKYLAERDKRLRSDGNNQYLRLTGVFADYLQDPYTEVKPRPPCTDHVTFAFIGGGFAGLVTGARLVEAGVTDVRIIEKGGDFGGTWYWNRYPGAQCDTASMIYMPLLEETGHMPSEKYAHAPEILAHCQRIGRQYGLYDKALFHTEVQSLVWQADQQRWRITTQRGDDFTARFVGMGTGPLHVPKLPGIPGIEGFKGHAFHTSRWDYAYTGGDPLGAPLDRLADKRVAIIGTGATAVQCIPHLARACKKLYVCQRTPSSVDVRANAPIDPAWFSGIATPGWQQRWLENFTDNQAGGGATEDLVQDGWTDLSRQGAHCDPAARGAQRGKHACCLRGRGLRKDGGDPQPRRFDRERSRDRRAAQSLVPPTLQASVLSRCLSRRVQRAGGRTARYRWQGRGAHHRTWHRREGCRVSGRLHHLRVRIRGGYRVDTPRRF
jgi:thioredoxin reductase